MNVYEAISAVQAELAKSGISKDRKASGGGASYSFRGIDDVYSHLAPLLPKHGLVIIPRCISRDCAERQSKNGGALFYVTVHAEFDFVSSKDGSKHTCATFGEAMDSSDKATNKAMSAAYKYAAFMTFCIPVEGDNDTENANHQVEVRQSPELTALLAELHAITDVNDCKPFADNTAERRMKLTPDEKEVFKAAYTSRKAALSPATVVDDKAAAVSNQDALLAQIRTLAGAAGVPTADIFKKYKVLAMTELTEDQAVDCIDALNARIKEKG